MGFRCCFLRKTVANCAVNVQTSAVLTLWHMRLTTLSLSGFWLLSHLLNNLSTKPEWLQSNSWCRNCCSSSKIDSKIRPLTLSDSWLNSAGLFKTRCSLSGEDYFFKTTKVLFWSSAWQIVFISVLNTGYIISDMWEREKCTLMSKEFFFFNDAVESSCFFCF